MDTIIDNSERKSNLLNAVVDTLPDGESVHVSIGTHWTAVVVEVDGEQRCGLASTLGGSHVHGVADIPQAGQLESLTGLELAAFTQETQPVMVSVGVAAINALLQNTPAHGQMLMLKKLSLIMELASQLPLLGISHSCLDCVRASGICMFWR